MPHIETTQVISSYMPPSTTCSDLRQVPDTQEVFLFPDSDSSIIFEILEIVREEQAANDLREAVRCV